MAPAACSATGRYDIEDTNDINYTVRAVATFDARTQTEYGTLAVVHPRRLEPVDAGRLGRRHHAV